MQQILNEQEMRSLAEIESVLDSAPSYSVEYVQQMLSTDEKGRVYQSIDNCMIALQNDPVLCGAICHNDLHARLISLKTLAGISQKAEESVTWMWIRLTGIWSVLMDLRIIKR